MLMWNTCTGQWCGSKYEQAYKEGYETGFEDARRILNAEQHGNSGVTGSANTTDSERESNAETVIGRYVGLNRD
jgi:hypothetical protein